jgi:hypothetical protein
VDFSHRSSARQTDLHPTSSGSSNRQPPKFLIERSLIVDWLAIADCRLVIAPAIDPPINNPQSAINNQSLVKDHQITN